MIRLILFFIGTLGITFGTFTNFINGWSSDSPSSTTQIIFFIGMIFALLGAGYEIRKLQEKGKDKES
ncbi:hypothetical protein [Cytobacillus horneckiae]|uniref:Uncharacterized protein n=1 Tax=Cytobacillus horneckiae TaxID=549687 RepID=A0A2N0ZN07_9BACI|nr:hypothetical protein [Cytobacillus horneckiae]NRG43330.1 hypothetical protein [Bacillus sp. CRN 9]PKG30866.1 hypothetical protein CWS20_01225 [Cytobacillus horneckiae]